MGGGQYCQAALADPVTKTFAEMPSAASAQDFLPWKCLLNESADFQSLQGESVLVERSSAPRCQPGKSLSPSGPWS